MILSVANAALLVLGDGVSVLSIFYVILQFEDDDEVDLPAGQIKDAEEVGEATLTQHPV